MRRLSLAALLATASVPVLAAGGQDSAPVPPVEDEALGAEIIVLGGRPRGAVIGAIEPELQLDEADIEATGASSLADLLGELAPQTRSGRGRGGEAPVVLVNGKRVSGFSEIRTIPPEAVERVDILPEEVSLSYGYRADQRVINFVLKERFRSVTAEIEGGGPTAGGRGEAEFDLNLLRLAGDSRILVDASHVRRSQLLESARDITQAQPSRPYALAGNIIAATDGAEIDPALSALAGTPVLVAAVPATAAAGAQALVDFLAGANNPALADTGLWRTLLPEQRETSLGANVSTALTESIQASFSALAGTPVLVAAVPATAAAGAQALVDFLAGANNPALADTGLWRTLLPEQRETSLGANVSTALTESIQASFSARLEWTESDRRLGLAGVTLDLPAANPFSPFAGNVQLLRHSEAAGALMGRSRNMSLDLAATVNGDISIGDGLWRWIATGGHNRSVARSTTDRRLDVTASQARILAGDPLFNPFDPDAVAGEIGQDRARSVRDFSRIELVANGQLLELPAGPVAMSVQAGADRQGFDSDTFIAGVAREVSLERNRLSGQASLDLPVASRRRDVLPYLGELALNLNASVNELSDFGTLSSLGGGVSWRPVDALRLSANVTVEDGAPSVQQLGNPTIITPNVRVFDFLRGETVDISRLDGGNPGLMADRRRVLKLGANLKPLPEKNLSLSADYVDSRITGPIAAFPTATAELEAAFPERFLRDADGRLVQIDNRPVNFERSDRRELRWGLSYSGQLKPSRAEQAAMERGRAAAAAGNGGGETAGRPSGPPPGARGSRGGGRSSGRATLSLFHTVKLAETILIRDSVPKLDLLGGSATGSSGGVSRHEVEMRAGLFRNGVGGRLSANWKSATDVRVDPRGAPSPDDLRFSDLATFNLRLFANLGQQQSLVAKAPWLKGARISIGIDNLFDSRQAVRDRLGNVPIGYQADLLDPVGRRIEISFRKIFL